MLESPSRCLADAGRAGDSRSAGRAGLGACVDLAVAVERSAEKRGRIVERAVVGVDRFGAGGGVGLDPGALRKVCGDLGGSLAVHARRPGQLVDGGLPDRAHAAEVLEQALAAGRADAGDRVELAAQRALAAAIAV